MRKKGVTNVRAKYPYTTVGIPAKTSSIGFNIFLNLSGAYSDKNIAAHKPSIKAIIPAIIATKIVPATSGKTPKLGMGGSQVAQLNKGVQLVPIRNSITETGESRFSGVSKKKAKLSFTNT